MDYTVRIIAACEDAIERFPEMPVIVYQALCNYILTGELTGDEPYDALNATGEYNPETYLHTALISLMPSMETHFPQWERHLNNYYKHAEEYEERKGAQHGLH